MLCCVCLRFFFLLVCFALFKVRFALILNERRFFLFSTHFSVPTPTTAPNDDFPMVCNWCTFFFVNFFFVFLVIFVRKCRRCRRIIVLLRHRHTFRLMIFFFVLIIKWCFIFNDDHLFIRTLAHNLTWFFLCSVCSTVMCGSDYFCIVSVFFWFCSSFFINEWCIFRISLFILRKSLKQWINFFFIQFSFGYSWSPRLWLRMRMWL